VLPQVSAFRAQFPLSPPPPCAVAGESF